MPQFDSSLVICIGDALPLGQFRTKCANFWLRLAGDRHWSIYL